MESWEKAVRKRPGGAGVSVRECVLGHRGVVNLVDFCKHFVSTLVNFVNGGYFRSTTAALQNLGDVAKLESFKIECDGALSSFFAQLASKPRHRGFCWRERIACLIQYMHAIGLRAASRVCAF
jgi:hypothetical protein